jgi:DNA-binding response OmpR family regulator
MKQQTLSGDILVVDDTPENLHLLITMLNGCGYSVRPALSGELALTSARNSSPDIILLDIMMPEMDGYEVCQHLKSDPLTCDIPVIFLSALGEAVDKVKAFNVGGIDYITKPFFLEEVMSRIETQLEIQRLRKQDKRNIERLSEEVTERKQAEQALYIANNNLDQQNRQLERVHELFRSTLDHLVDIVHRGASNDELSDYLSFMQNEFTLLEKCEDEGRF